MFLVLFIVLVLLRLFGKIESWWTVLGTMFLIFLFFTACTGSFALGLVIGSGKTPKVTHTHTVVQ